MLKNNLLAEQFVAVYGPATPFTAAPLFHITLVDARKLRTDGDGDFCNRGRALRLRTRAAGRTDIVAFVLPTDELVHREEGCAPDYVDQRDKCWHGSSLKPTLWLMDANAWGQFWARVVTSAWHGFVHGTRGAAVRVMTAAELAAQPVYVAEKI